MVPLVLLSPTCTNFLLYHLFCTDVLGRIYRSARFALFGLLPATRDGWCGGWSNVEVIIPIILVKVVIVIIDVFLPRPFSRMMRIGAVYSYVTCCCWHVYCSCVWSMNFFVSVWSFTIHARLKPRTFDHSFAWRHHLVFASGRCLDIRNFRHPFRRS